MSESQVRIGVLMPEVLGTYGDTGNALVLRERARRRGIDAEIVTIGLDKKIPSELDIYTLGGGEDSAQALAAQKLLTDKGLRRALDNGRPLLAVCASLQILGHWYEDARGNKETGMGVLDVTTVPQNSRSIGELVTEPLLDELSDTLTGFENHGGATLLGDRAAPLGRVLAGVGNSSMELNPAINADDVDRIAYEGVVQGSIIATYMHGPVLARNPELADLLLARATGIGKNDLARLEIPGVENLRRERLAASGIER
ncbi:MAG: glutamine amidotransferase [Actinobacteria bacterium]|nr:MAG: glutamine amidotransferase [Actinomycetota bacterium]